MDGISCQLLFIYYSIALFVIHRDIKKKSFMHTLPVGDNGCILRF